MDTVIWNFVDCVDDGGNGHAVGIGWGREFGEG